jgi:hypothetical protein
MNKALIQSGNSLALVIDKPLRRMLGLGPSRMVDLRTDGRRLIIEAAAEPQPRDATAPAVPPAVLMNAAKVARQLVELHGMSQQALQRLYPDCPHVARYLARADAGERATPKDQQALFRMHVCHEQLVAGRSWEDAMAIAEYVVPNVVPNRNSSTDER